MSSLPVLTTVRVYHDPTIKPKNACFLKGGNDDVFGQPNPLTEGEVVNTTQRKSHNGFIGAAYLAFANHHELVFEPQDAWQAILRQFSIYVTTRDNEKMRELLVPFAGKKALEVSSLEPPELLSWNDIVLAFSLQIKENLKPASAFLADDVLHQFTTSRPYDVAVCATILMSTLQQFFEYRVFTMCGIPAIYVGGTVDDWTWIIDATLRLQRLDVDGCLKHWLYDLRGALTRIKDSVALGKESPETAAFWKSLIREDSGSGDCRITGWFGLFNYFNEKGQKAWDDYQGKTAYPRIKLEDVCCGLARAPVRVIDLVREIEYKCEVIAGSGDIIVQPRLDGSKCLVGPGRSFTQTALVEVARGDKICKPGDPVKTDVEMKAQ